MVIITTAFTKLLMATLERAKPIDIRAKCTPAALPNAPSYLDYPIQTIKELRLDKNWCSNKMVDQGMITQAEADYAYQQDLELVG